MALMASRFRYCRFRNGDYGSFLLTHVSLPILLSNYFTWILCFVEPKVQNPEFLMNAFFELED